VERAFDASAFLTPRASKFLAIQWRGALLSPRFRKWSGVDRIKPQCVYRLENNALRRLIVPGDGKRDAARDAGSSPELQQVVRNDTVKGFDDWMVDLLFHPLAFGQTSFDRLTARLLTRGGIKIERTCSAQFASKFESALAKSEQTNLDPMHRRCVIPCHTLNEPWDRHDPLDTLVAAFQRDRRHGDDSDGTKPSLRCAFVRDIFSWSDQ
jgi:hypothetical protein